MMLSCKGSTTRHVYNILFLVRLPHHKLLARRLSYRNDLLLLYVCVKACAQASTYGNRCAGPNASHVAVLSRTFAMCAELFARMQSGLRVICN
mmetsp:Transcript_5627/g.12329  ORF Transcript_5627/g.12329 Transcript_5627/m.12329 type:complete len:93 (+) Transcript_5627:1109-1387(+)